MGLTRTHRGPPRYPSNRLRDQYVVSMRVLFPSYGKVLLNPCSSARRSTRMLTLPVLARIQMRSSSRVRRLTSTRFRMTYPRSKKYLSRRCSRYGKALRQGKFGASYCMKHCTLATACTAHYCALTKCELPVTRFTTYRFSSTQRRDTRSVSRVGSSFPWSYMGLSRSSPPENPPTSSLSSTMLAIFSLSNSRKIFRGNLTPRDSPSPRKRLAPHARFLLSV
jgi:hypothetical protein